MMFEDMSTEQFATYLGNCLDPIPAIAIDRTNGPTLPIYSIKSGLLPCSLVRIIHKILYSESVVDEMPIISTMEIINSLHTGKPVHDYSTCITSAHPGAMRSWHSNEFQYLPTIRLNLTDLSSVDQLGVKDRRSKAQKYHQYIISNKGQQNKMVGRTDGIYTGYIEFTATGWRQGVQHGRLVYNYKDNILFLTFHYTDYLGSHESPKNPFFLIKYEWGAPGKSSE